MWVMNKGTGLTIARSPKWDSVVSDWSRATPVAVLYDYQRVFDLPYAKERELTRTLSMTKYNSDENITGEPLNYLNMIGFDKYNRPVQIFVSPTVMFNLELQKEFRETLENEGIQKEIGISDVVETRFFADQFYRGKDPAQFYEVVNRDVWGRVINRDSGPDNWVIVQ
jgi:hypothetical protein